VISYREEFEWGETEEEIHKEAKCDHFRILILCFILDPREEDEEVETKGIEEEFPERDEMLEVGDFMDVNGPIHSQLHKRKWEWAQESFRTEGQIHVEFLQVLTFRKDVILPWHSEPNLLV